MKKILIVESQPLMRRALARLVEPLWPNACVAEAGSMAEFQAMCRTGGPIGLVVMDPALSDATGLSALIAAQQLLPQTPVVIFSARQDDEIIASSRALGALGYIQKSSEVGQILQVLRSAAAGVPAFPALKGAATAGHELAAMRRRMAQLTPTQMKVLMNVAGGRLNKQVAADMHVTEAAIKAHLTGIFRKLGVSNRTQALLAVQPILAVEPRGIAA